MKFLIRMLIPTFLFLLTSCEQEWDLEGYRDSELENTLVVNAILNPDSLLRVSVTRPFFFSQQHSEFSPVENLAMTVSDTNGQTETLKYDPGSKSYFSTIYPHCGERYEIAINTNREIIITHDEIPHKVDIQDVSVGVEGPIHIYWDTDYRFTYKITFQDTKGEPNYYFLAIDDNSLPYEFSQMGQVDYTGDYVFHVLASVVNNGLQGWQPDGVFGYPFSDEGIDGKQYSLTVTEILQTPLVQMIERLPRKIKLYSISKPYYEYMVSVLSMDYDESAFKGNLLSLGLMEPSKIYSNISGGAGIMGSYCLSTMEIDLLEHTGGWPKK